MNDLLEALKDMIELRDEVNRTIEMLMERLRQTPIPPARIPYRSRRAETLREFTSEIERVKELLEVN